VRLACLDQPALNVPQVLVMTDMRGSAGDDAAAHWQRSLDSFVERAFGYDFMRPFRDMRQESADRLRRWLSDLFEGRLALT
jgi:hypothetical protein